MAVNLYFTVEGQTEEDFVNQTLQPHLAARSIFTRARCVSTSRKGGVEYRGGIRCYKQALDDIRDWIRTDGGSDAHFTTMFDLYSLPEDFPCFQKALSASCPYERIRILEDALSRDVAYCRFIPYIQLHEFEALLLADPTMLATVRYQEHATAISRLAGLASQYGSPELINDGETTAPSKRIIAEIPKYRKRVAGPDTARQIGLPVPAFEVSAFRRMAWPIGGS